MNQHESHEMVGELLDALNEARVNGRMPVAIVMLGDAWHGLLADASATKFIVVGRIERPYTFQQIPLASASANGSDKFRFDYE